MGRFSRRFKRNPDRISFDESGDKHYSDFMGKKAQYKQLRKMFFNAQKDYWRKLKAGLITEDGNPVEQETTDEQE